MAFVFGLVHGLGFAGGLSEIGLPDHDVSLALVGFAAGVELGQVAFLAAVLVVVHAIRRWRHLVLARLAATYAIGSVSAYWLIVRVLALG
jgi:hypothetical protein